MNARRFYCAYNGHVLTAGIDGPWACRHCRSKFDQSRRQIDPSDNDYRTRQPTP